MNSAHPAANGTLTRSRNQPSAVRPGRWAASTTAQTTASTANPATDTRHATSYRRTKQCARKETSAQTAHQASRKLISDGDIRRVSAVRRAREVERLQHLHLLQRPLLEAGGGQ